MGFLKFITVSMLFTLIIMGCGRSHSSNPVGPGTEPGAVVGLKLALGSSGINQVLGKVSAINLNMLVIQFTSNSGDTLNDTLTSSTSPALNQTSTPPQTITKNYSLKALRTWKMVAKTLDQSNVIIHMDSVSISQLNPADTVAINLSMSSKYTMYDAKFLNIPDSISSSAPNTGKSALRITRLKMVIDSGLATEVVVDSNISPSYFAPLITHTLGYDYVSAGNRTVKLYVYGLMGGSDILLYYGSTIVNVSVGNDSTTNINLTWVGPTTGVAGVSVTIGKVGKVIVNGSLPGTVIN